MNDISPLKIKTGGDPRTLPDYSRLRDELSKLTHPARPDVSWLYVEQLSLSLFEQNGVELQTAAGYTLARLQLAGLSGLNEGLALLEALISHQWSALWPQPVHARIEILSSLSQRIQQQMRSLVLNYSDLGQLYRAEQLLTGLGEVLQRLELKHLSQLDALRALMHNSAVRLENREGGYASAVDAQPDVVMSAPKISDIGTSDSLLATVPTTKKNAPDRRVKRDYVAQPEHHAGADIVPAVPVSVKKWRFFTAGMCTMLVLSMAVAGGWYLLQRPDPLRVKLAESLAPLPVMLTPEQLNTLRQQPSLAQTAITETRQQLSRLDQLPPDWRIDFSRQLLEQARLLSPDQASALALEWHQKFRASALSAEKLESWHQGMASLQQLSDKLNGLDEQKGKYITVSELKSIIFSTMQSFTRSVPAEEQLRILSQVPPEQALPVAAQVELEMHLNQLIARYAEIKQKVSEKEGSTDK